MSDHRVGRSMRQNGKFVERTRQFIAKTDSDHSVNITPNVLDHDLTADRAHLNLAVHISYVWASEGWPRSIALTC